MRLGLIGSVYLSTKQSWKKCLVLFQQKLKRQVISYNNIADIRKLHSKNPHSQLLVSDSSLLLSCCRLQKLLNELYNPAHLPYVPFKLFSRMNCWKQSHLRHTTFFHGQEGKGNNKGPTYFPSNTSYHLLQRRYQMVRWHLSHFVPLLKERLKEHLTK